MKLWINILANVLPLTVFSPPRSLHQVMKKISHIYEYLQVLIDGKRTILKFSKNAEKQKKRNQRNTKSRVVCNTSCAFFPHSPKLLFYAS